MRSLAFRSWLVRPHRPGWSSSPPPFVCVCVWLIVVLKRLGGGGTGGADYQSPNQRRGLASCSARNKRSSRSLCFFFLLNRVMNMTTEKYEPQRQALNAPPRAVGDLRRSIWTECAFKCREKKRTSGIPRFMALVRRSGQFGFACAPPSGEDRQLLKLNHCIQNQTAR